MDDLLTPVSTTYLKARKDEEPFLAEVKSTRKSEAAAKASSVTSADDVLDILKNQPDYDSLISVLRFLAGHGKGASDAFELQVPGPKSASIVHVLVSEISPNYWALLSEDSPDDGADVPSGSLHGAKLLLQCLRSVTGINAVLSHLKALVQESKLENHQTKRPDLALNLRIFLEMLSAVLDGDAAIQATWTTSTAKLTDPILKKTQSHNLVSAITSGRIPSIAAEASAVLGREEVPAGSRWLADGAEFSKWIGRNVAAWAALAPKDVELQACFSVFHRAMSLGYADGLVKIIIDELLLSPGRDHSLFSRVCFYQSQGVNKVLQILLEYLSRRFLNGLILDDSTSHSTVSAVAGVIDAVVQQDAARKAYLINWCATPSGAGLGNGIGIRRAVLAVLAKDRDSVTTLLEKSLGQFGDQLYIKHAAILQQDVHTQILLLTAGYVSRLSPIKLSMLVRSGTYLSTISNRIAATQARARFLGMAVGESLSVLAEQAKKLDFHMEEMDTEEAAWYKDLVNVSDVVGPIDPILSTTSPRQSRAQATPKPTSKPKARPKPKPTAAPTLPKAIIEEINSSDDEDDQDLQPYTKGSDPEDSDEDATLVQRNKIRPPVYVRDLIASFRDSESYDKQKLALQTAPLLIRRKANFGTEVSSHAEELAGLLMALQDKFDFDDFDDKRLQGMIALVVAQPKLMAPWFARTFFEGDYSLSQRVSVLVTLGLSARELAGLQTSEYQSAAAFPSKRLPEKIENLYIGSPKPSDRVDSSHLKAIPSTALDTITQSLTSSFLAPIAAEAADATTGPDVLKLQSFTARYKSKSKAKPRVRAIPNTTAALVANSFFSPLTAHFQLALRSSKPVVLNPALLALYLQTLGIVINAAGPSTLSLPQLTSELWDLLLGVRVHVMDDQGALKGWLVAMSALLEVNQGDMRQLCQTQAREVMETREWVSGVFQKIRGEDGGEENEVKMLAAGVLIKIGEAIEKYQALLMGDLVGFS